jgi:uncharacterized membrane protein (DUF106 family)
MEKVQNEIEDTKRKIEVAERGGDTKRRDRLEDYLIELQRKENILLSAAAGNSSVEFLCFTSIMM